MKRLACLLIVLFLALPQLAFGAPAALSVAAAGPAQPTIILFDCESDEYQATWTMLTDSGSFECRLDGQLLEGLYAEPELNAESGLYEYNLSGFGDEPSVGVHTFEVRAVDSETGQTSEWASATTTVLPTLPIQIELKGANYVAYNTTCTVVVTAPAGKKVTVQWVNPRDEGASHSPVTFDDGDCTYSFKARFTGLVLVTFVGDGEHRATAFEKPVAVHVVMSRAYLPPTAKPNRTFTVWSTMTFKQSRSTWVRFYCYRNEKQSSGKYRYVLRKTVVPNLKSFSATKTKLYKSFSLPKAGRWRIVPSYEGPETFPAASNGAAGYITIQ